jgi:hypothetical protein
MHNCQSEVEASRWSGKGGGREEEVVYREKMDFWAIGERAVTCRGLVRWSRSGGGAVRSFGGRRSVIPCQTRTLN